MGSPVSERVLALARELLEILIALNKAEDLVLTPCAQQQLRERFDAIGRNPFMVYRVEKLGGQIRRVELLIRVCVGDTPQSPAYALDGCSRAVLQFLDCVLDEAPAVFRINDELASRIERARGLRRQLSELVKRLTSGSGHISWPHEPDTVTSSNRPALQLVLEQIHADRERYIEALLEIQETVKLLRFDEHARGLLQLQMLRPALGDRGRLGRYYWPIFTRNLATMIRAQRSELDGIVHYIDSLVMGVRSQHLDIAKVGEACRTAASAGTEDVLDEPRLSGYNLRFLARVLDQLFGEEGLTRTIEAKAERHLEISDVLSRYRRGAS